jgi:hypothetical protein
VQWVAKNTDLTALEHEGRDRGAVSTELMNGTEKQSTGAIESNAS